MKQQEKRETTREPVSGVKIETEVKNLAENTILYDDIPSAEGRLSREMEVYGLLKKLQIPYKRMDHKAMATIEDCKGVDEVLQITMCKNLFLCNSQKTQFYLLMMPGEKKFKTKELSGQIGSARLSFASAEAMEEYLHISPGAVSVMGLMNDQKGHVRLLIDEDVLKEEYLGCHPCVNTASLKIRTEDVLKKFLPYVKHEYTVVQLAGE